MRMRKKTGRMAAFLGALVLFGSSLAASAEEIVVPETQMDVQEAEPIAVEAYAEEPGVEEMYSEAQPEEPVTEEPHSEAQLQGPITEEAYSEAQLQEPITEEPYSEAQPQEPITEEAYSEAQPQEPITEEAYSEVQSEEPVTEEPYSEMWAEEPVTDMVEQTEEPQSDLLQEEMILIEPETQDASVIMEPETEVKTQVCLEVRDTFGELLPVEEFPAPGELTCADVTHPVDYRDGVYLVSVPEETREICLVFDGMPEGQTDDIKISRWGGYLFEQDGNWLLCPDETIGEICIQEGNTCIVDLEKCSLDPAEMTLEQIDVYGARPSEADCAEVFVNAPDFCALFLVERTPEDDEAVSEAEDTESLSAADDSLESAGEENAGEIQTEEFIYDEIASERTTEQETENFTEISLEDEIAPVLATDPQTVKKVYEATGKNLASSAQQYTPQVSSTNGEWQILGLARSGQAVDDSLYSRYVANVIALLQENQGVLHERKYTEYSRVVLALTALGEDVTNVGGYNLLEPLADFDQTIWQGINGAIFALIAFDSHGYEIPQAPDGKNQTTRENLIACILGREISGGGWALSGTSADADITAMALTALAPYRETDSAVQAAVERGIAKLSEMQKGDGGFGSSWGEVSSEGCSQVIVALTALGIDPGTDKRFIKNGKSVVDALTAYSNADGSFNHTSKKDPNQMATEQAYYALTSYYRFLDGKTSLYDMSDVVLKSDRAKAKEADALLAALPNTVTLADKERVNAASVIYDNLSNTQKKLLSPENVSKLQNALEQLKKLEQDQPQTDPQSGEDSKNPGGTGTDNNKNPGGTGTDNNKNPGGTGTDNNKNPGGTGTDNSKNPSGTNTDNKDDNKNNNSSTATKQPSGSTKQVNLTGGSSGSGTTTTTKVRTATVSPTSGSAKKNESESETEKESESETETETETTVRNRQGGTKATANAGKVISALTNLFGGGGSETALPELAKDYTQEQVAAILDIYRAMQLLNEDDRQTVEKNSRYQEYLKVIGKMGERNHFEEATGTNLLDNEEEVLPWYVRVEVDDQPGDEASRQTVRTSLQEKGEALTLQDIHFVDTLDDSEWHPQDIVRVSLPMVDLGDYENFAIVHIKDSGAIEFLEGHLSGSDVEFDTDEFSVYGIVGFHGTLGDLMKGDAPERSWWICAVPGGVAALLLILLLIFGRKRERQVFNVSSDR